SVERGHDVRDFSLLCFGGAGGLHAVDLAAGLEMPRVFVPGSPGTLSALGVLGADVIKDLSRTVLGLSLDAIEEVLAALEREGRQVLAREGFSRDVRVERMVDLRYAGQSYEITVYYSSGFENQFHDSHQRVFGHCNREAPTEMVNARVRLVVPTPSVEIPEIAPGGEDAAGAIAGTQACWFAGWHDTPIYERDLLRAGNVVQGPAIVAEFTSTTLIAPGMSGRVDGHGNILVEVKR
ncbi:MAG: hydantoinase/oxoprolinase family protein, partial [Armatimonadetes bacterium]|nr:hydantoinase/oxoprolinase family protein [Armatimonadota bacterium]